MGDKIDRRDALTLGGKMALAAGMGLGSRRLWAEASSPSAKAPSAKPDPEDWYINPQASPFDVPEFTGEYYRALVPDTLDLAEMARRLIHPMIAATDPAVDHEVYWWVIFGSKPPRMVHQFSDQVQFQFMASLPLMRLMSGSTEGGEAERGFLAGAIKNLGAGGLFYNMPKRRPWVEIIDQSTPPEDKPPKGKPFANMLQSAMMLNMLNSYGQLTHDKRWTQAAQRCAETYVRYAVESGEYAYYPKWEYVQDEARSDRPPPQNFYRGWCDGDIMLPLLQHFELTGSKPVGDLARKIMNSYMRSYTGYDPNGNFLAEFKGNVYLAFPVWASINPLEWGLRTNDPAMLETARRNFERYRGYIQPLTGFVPEVLHLEDPTILHTAESCFLSYVIVNAVLLSAAGAGDYWDDVDRWVRNQFAEAQLRHVDWVERMLKGRPERTLPLYSTSEDVPERNVGAMAGFMQFNDWFGGYVHPVARAAGGAAIQHCCTARSAVAVYDVWKNILDYKAGKLRVNLLLNRASKWADVDSHIPYVGQVDVKVKEPVELSVRLPEWVKPQEVQARVDGTLREVSFRGRYAEVGGIKPGGVVTLTFPIRERDASVVVEGREYTLRLRGNTVVSIDPLGSYSPVYQRAYYREGQTRWREITRFIAAGDHQPREGHPLSL